MVTMLLIIKTLRLYLKRLKTWLSGNCRRCLLLLFIHQSASPKWNNRFVLNTHIFDQNTNKTYLDIPFHSVSLAVEAGIGIDICNITFKHQFGMCSQFWRMFEGKYYGRNIFKANNLLFSSDAIESNLIPIFYLNPIMTDIINSLYIFIS